EDPAIVGAFVRLLERRGLRAERPVSEEFHVAELQPLVALTCPPPGRERRLEIEASRVANLRRGPGGRERKSERSMRDAHQCADLQVTALARPPQRGV